MVLHIVEMRGRVILWLLVRPLAQHIRLQHLFNVRVVTEAVFACVFTVLGVRVEAGTVAASW